MSVSASGRWLALASEDGRVAIWDMVSGSEMEVHTAGSPSGAVADIAFDPLETTLAIALQDKVLIWRVGAPCSRSTRREPTRITWSPRRLLAAAE